MFASFRGPELDFSVAAAGDEEVGGLLNERAAVYRVKEDFSLLVLLFLLKLLLSLEGEFRRVVGANGFSMAEEVVRVFLVQFLSKKFDGTFRVAQSQNKIARRLLLLLLFPAAVSSFFFFFSLSAVRVLWIETQSARANVLILPQLLLLLLLSFSKILFIQKRPTRCPLETWSVRQQNHGRVVSSFLPFRGHE